MIGLLERLVQRTGQPYIVAEDEEKMDNDLDDASLLKPIFSIKRSGKSFLLKS